MRKVVTAAAALCVLTPIIAFAAEPRTAHTYQLEPGEERPPASLEDASWLVGSWVGTGFGQRIEEVWNPPTAGSMVGMFKLYGEEGVAFYELMLLVVEDGSLSLKVKHFDPDFTAWEEKADYGEFRLVKKEEAALHFHGLSFYRRDDDVIDVYIVIRRNDSWSEHHLAYERRY